MPRYVRRDRKLTTAERAMREGVDRVRGYKNFVDPFPLGFGTLPEKMVYAELSRRNIPFLYLNDLRFQIPEIDFDKWYQADFAIPSLKIIIEIQGAYWHSKPAAIESDAYKFAIYQTTGWKPVAWWDFDILVRLQELFSEVPELVAATRVDPNTRSAELPVQSRKKTDTSKGIRTLNQKRAQRLAYKKKPVGVKIKKSRKGVFSYGTG